MTEGLLYLNIRRFCGVRLRLLPYCKRQGYWYIDVHMPTLDSSSGLRSDAAR